MTGILRLVRFGLLSCAAIGLLLAGCGETTDPTDGGEDAYDAGPDTCEVDDSAGHPSTAPDWELIPDAAPTTGYICPRTDEDHYWFSVPNAGTIVSVELSNAVSLSAVDLCYRILPPSGTGQLLGDQCDHNGADGVTELRGSHYLPEAGNYFLEVRDEAGDEEDARNPYGLTITQVEDPDLNESNNSIDEPTPLAASTQGYISYLGDQDWFQIDVGQAGQIMTIDLSSPAASPVDLRYTLYADDGTTPVNTGVDDNGMDGATSLADVLPVNEAGTYYLVVIDELNDDTDLEVGYNLTVSLRSNPDNNESNNSYDSATPLSSGSAVTGYLATRADEDWYRIEIPGVSDTNPAVLEVELEFPQGAPTDMEPAVDLIVGDPNTGCNPGDACDTLNWSCGGGCDMEFYTACANAQCPSHECLQHVDQCRGAGFCLPEGGCGIRHLNMHGQDWSPTGNLHHLKTAAPMYGSVYYVLVRDFYARTYEIDRPYILTVTHHDEPDGNESPTPNGRYLPYATNDQDEEARSANKSVATTISCTTGGTPPNDYVQCGPMTGWLSFRGDQDWFRLNNFPTEAEAAPVDLSTDVDYDLQFDWSFGGSSSLFINYAIWEGGGVRDRDIQSGWNHQGSGSGTFGDGECAYLCGEYHDGRPIYMRVMDNDRKDYDFSPGGSYSVTLRAYKTCPMSCSEYCAPDVTDYACPNPGNPCPQGDCQ